MKQPWLKFYPADWRAEPSLRICSVAARGLWIEMLCIMHDAEPCGCLAVGGSPVTLPQLAGLVGAPLKQTQAMLDELERAKVFSRDDDGVIYSRRMRRDIEKAARDKANGGRGGNPKLKGSDNGGVNPPDKSADKRGDKAQKPEARDQRPEAADAASAAAGAGPPGLEAECRAMAGEEPIVLAQDWHVVEALLAEGITPDDVRTGIREALAKPRDPKQRFRHWSQIAGWARRAAQDRLAGKPGAAGRVGDDEPRVDFGGGVRVKEQHVRHHVAAHRADPAKWPPTMGPPPGAPGCRVPERFLGAVA